MTASVKPLPKSKKSPWTNSSKPKRLGFLGEERACAFLISLGFQILARNVRVGRGEIDVIAWDVSAAELVFVEVKTRRHALSGDPSLAINFRKLSALRQSCLRFLRETWKKPGTFRIDVLAIIPGKIRHYRNITWG